MTTSESRTEFLPVARADAETVRRQRAVILDAPKLVKVLDAVPDIVVFLNQERQIVYANKAAIGYILAHGGTPEAGKRWGEALLCAHSSEVAGCGTTSFCRACGGALATLSSQRGHDAIENCRITQLCGDALDFMVTTARLTLNGDSFTVFSAMDVGDEKRREALEKTFFHDVLNTASGVQGLVELMPDATSAERDSYVKILHGLSYALIEEIVAQRDLLAAENRDLSVHPAPIDALALLREVVSEYRERDIAKGKTIDLDAASAGVELTSDRTLLRRVLGNMIKNALEATSAGKTVTAGCASKDGLVEFWVHNPEAMPDAVRLQVFLRSFSTKGAGRGLGTYSMKLLTERYLGGTIAFTSERGEGTRFTARYPLVLAP
ncbi:MAG: sensor histidine kinase [Elusimicrobiota bacterium]